MNLFVGSTVKIDDVAGTDVELVQDTDYPWNGKVSITVNPAKPVEISVQVRVPRHDVSALLPLDAQLPMASWRSR